MNKNLFIIIAAIILLPIVLSILTDPLSLSLNGTSSLTTEVITECRDGTKIDSCSLNSYQYCNEDGVLVDNPDMCGCAPGYRAYGGGCIEKIACSDGSLDPECSPNKPYRCVGGVLVEQASWCGCPDDDEISGDSCIGHKKCDDGTIYGQCSFETPLFCDVGALVNKASLCGCPPNTRSPDGESCVSIYALEPKEQFYSYTINGERRIIKLTTYGGGDDEDATIKYLIANGTAGEVLDELVEAIKARSSNRDEQARIAISVVQNIPYDYSALYSYSYALFPKHPYEVLHTKSGVCSEKSNLLVYLLKGLGYKTAIFTFDLEDHAAVGIACPDEYSYKNSGYCFIESTVPSIITDSYGIYLGAGKLSSDPEITEKSDGAEYSSASEAYNDALRYYELADKDTLTQSEYREWELLVKKYGIELI